MKNNKGNQEFIWRENDESASTLLKYDLEASHWVRAVKRAERKHMPVSMGASLGVIGLILGLILNLILLFLLLITYLVKYLRK